MSPNSQLPTWAKHQPSYIERCHSREPAPPVNTYQPSYHLHIPHSPANLVNMANLINDNTRRLTEALNAIRAGRAANLISLGFNLGQLRTDPAIVTIDAALRGIAHVNAALVNFEDEINDFVHVQPNLPTYWWFLRGFLQKLVHDVVEAFGKICLAALLFIACCKFSLTEFKPDFGTQFRATKDT